MLANTVLLNPLKTSKQNKTPTKTTSDRSTLESIYNIRMKTAEVVTLNQLEKINGKCNKAQAQVQSGGVKISQIYRVS